MGKFEGQFGRFANLEEFDIPQEFQSKMNANPNPFETIETKKDEVQQFAPPSASDAFESGTDFEDSDDGEEQMPF